MWNLIDECIRKTTGSGFKEYHVIGKALAESHRNQNVESFNCCGFGLFQRDYEARMFKPQK